jgi:hypothetical protein
MSVVSGVTQAIMGSNAASDAADTQAAATKDASNQSTAIQEKAIDENTRQFETTRADNEKIRVENLANLAPWRTAGSTNALTILTAKTNAGPGEFTKSPGYEFRLAEGTKAINNSAAARGNALSGAAVKALTRYGQDYATNDYQNFLANYYNSLIPYQNLSNTGLTAASGGTTSNNQMAVANSGLTSNQANTNSNLNSSMANTNYLATVAAGNAQAGGYINNANAISGALNSTSNNSLLAWQMAQKYKTPAATPYQGGGGPDTYPEYYELLA